MLRFRLTFLIVLGLALTTAAGRDVRQVRSSSESNHPASAAISVASLQLNIQNNDVVLTWEPLLGCHPVSGKFLSGYQIYFSRTVDDSVLLRMCWGTHYRHRGAAASGGGFYRVVGVYNEESGPRRPPLRIVRGIEVILDFEDDLDLISYDEDEDVSPDAWGMANDETLPESAQSLCLRGNCWKKLPFRRVNLTDSTVWSIGILSLDGDTLADLQAFGVGDGSNQLLYTFHGRRTVWEQAWQIANQDVNPRGRWSVYHLAVGYDWTIRYGYVPAIDELYFINDNDTNNPSSRIYFDDVIDVTSEYLPEPAPKIRWFVRQDVETPGAAVQFNASAGNRNPDELAFFWEFGDGGVAEGRDLVHVYAHDGVYTLSLTAEDDHGRRSSVSEWIEIGEARFPVQMTACFTGDVMLARRYEDVGGIIRQFGPEYVFQLIQPRISQADLCVINLECPLTDEGAPHPTKDITFRGNPANVAGLSFAGVDLATLANNHVVDYGLRGMQETQEVLDAAGIGWCGAGADEYQALLPVFRTVNSVRIGVLSFCNRTGRDYGDRPFLDASFDRYGYAYFSADNILRSVPAADEQCDVLVVAAHGGWEYATEPTALMRDAGFAGEEDLPLRVSAERDSATRELEHLCIDLGADIIIGTHPHVLQGFEVYSGAFIAHSLGNFAFDQNFFETWPSATVWADITRGGVSRVWIEPIFVDNYRPSPAFGLLGRKILDRLADYSYELNAVVVPEYHRHRAEIIFEPQRLTSAVREYTVSGVMRWDQAEGLYISEPLRLNGGGFPSCIESISPHPPDAGWTIQLGREILLVGNMELEGATIWNYNSRYESPSDVARGGLRSSQLNRNQGMQDGITDLLQRIPISDRDRLTLCGWLRTTNSRDGGLCARYYDSRYGANNQNILGDQVVERRLQGDNDWTYVWDNLVIPDNCPFMNVRWQLYGALQGGNQLWCDDVELIRWEEPVVFEGNLGIDYPNDLYYLQLRTRMPLDSVTVTYRATTLGVR